MNLSLLQFLVIGSAILLLVILIDAWRRNKLRIFHVLIFGLSLVAVVIVSLYPNLLQKIADVVWVSKWSDFLVYMAIIFLVFVFFSLLQNLIEQQQEMTRLCTAQAIRNYHIHNIVLSDNISKWHKDNYVFLIRAYNEASVLRSVIDEIIDAGFQKIIIINDGSSDDTEWVIAKIIHDCNTQATIIWLHHLINRWPWAANKTLFEFVRRHGEVLNADRYVTYDADGQMNIADMERFMQHADKKLYDVIIGSRFVSGASAHNMPFIRRVILYWARIVTYIFNGIWISDVSTWYRMYHKDAIHKITIYSDRFSYQNDIIDALSQHKMRFVEIPVHIKYTDYSLNKGQSNLSAIKILMRLIYSSLFHR